MGQPSAVPPLEPRAPRSAGTGLTRTVIDRILSVFRQLNLRAPLSQGFWKTHSEAWPVSSLTLGSQSYTQAELLAILNTPVKGDASLILANQLIAAKLNIANGSDPAPISVTITHADSLLSGFTGKLPYKVKTSSTTGQAMVNDASVLDSYNNGQLTPNCTPRKPTLPGVEGLFPLPPKEWRVEVRGVWVITPRTVLEVLREIPVEVLVDTDVQNLNHVRPGQEAIGQKVLMITSSELHHPNTLERSGLRLSE